MVIIISYVCSECGSILHKKPTHEEMIKNAIPSSEGIEISQLYEMYGNIMTITTIDIIINKFVKEYECYIPKWGYVASCYGNDGIRHMFPK